MRFCLSVLLSVYVFVAGFAVQGQPAGSVMVYAATSLTDAFEALKAAFEEAHPNAEIRLNFSSSSTLAAQLLAGAPADVFASANAKQMQLVIDDGRIAAEAVRVFAHNQLVLVLPQDTPAAIESLGDLADRRLLLVLAVGGTPIRAYTDALFEALQSEYGADFQARVMSNLVSEENNVRQVLARVALGEADAGIVYQTDALGAVSGAVQTIAIDRAYNQKADYLAAGLADASNPALAAAFIDFVLGADGQRILEAHGFCPPAEPDAPVEPTETAVPALTDDERGAEGRATATATQAAGDSVREDLDEAEAALCE